MAKDLTNWHQGSKIGFLGWAIISKKSTIMPYIENFELWPQIPINTAKSSML
jgi:hypothetical protein